MGKSRRRKTITDRKHEPLDHSQFSSLPGPLFKLLAQYDAESHPFRKVHRLIDGFEWAIKWHTVLTMSDMLRESELTAQMKLLLARGLRTPSLGIWNLFFRESMAALKNPLAPWSNWQRLVELEKKHQIVNFRNGYAHGATPTDEDCATDCDRFFPVLLQLIASEIFTQLGLVVSGTEGVLRLRGNDREKMGLKLDHGHAGATLPSGMVLDLWPLGLYVSDPKGKKGWNFFYFNALKNAKIEQLNYELPLMFRNKALWRPFHERFPLKDWAKEGSAETDLFRSRVDLLTESFKGRLRERKYLKKFCLDGNGTLMIWGVPGIGKSALIAQAFKEIKAGLTPDGEQAEITYPPVIEYFIRRGTEHASREQFLCYLNSKLDNLFHLKGIPMGNNENEMWEKLVERLNAVEEREGDQPLVLFVDGLDESPDIRTLIPASRSWLRIVLSSRPVETVIDWFRTWDRENRSETEIGPLTQADIRALLYEVVNKYQAPFNTEYIEEVEKRSQGNPLYLKLLCDKIYEQGGLVGDIKHLPKDIANLYQETIKRVSSKGTDKMP